MRTKRSYVFGVLVVMLAAATITSCSGAPGTVQPSARAGATSEGAGLRDVGPDLAAVRAATAQFHRAEVAVAAGYSFENEPCVASPAGTMGIHAPNLALVGTQALDPERPEALLYLPKPDGGFRLTAVEYIQVVLLRNPATGVVAPWFPSTPWPSNYVVVTPTPQLFGKTFDGPMPGHNPAMPWHWDLHVWVWANNPNGMFAQWNPSLSCN